MYDSYNYTMCQALRYSETYSNYNGNIAAHFHGLFRFNPDLRLTFILLIMSNYKTITEEMWAFFFLNILHRVQSATIFRHETEALRMRRPMPHQWSCN